MHKLTYSLISVGLVLWLALPAEAQHTVSPDVARALAEAVWPEDWPREAMVPQRPTLAQCSQSKLRSIALAVWPGDERGLERLPDKTVGVLNSYTHHCNQELLYYYIGAPAEQRETRAWARDLADDFLVEGYWFLWEVAFRNTKRGMAWAELAQRYERVLENERRIAERILRDSAVYAEQFPATIEQLPSAYRTQALDTWEHIQQSLDTIRQVQNSFERQELLDEIRRMRSAQQRIASELEEWNWREQNRPLRYPWYPY